MRSTKAITALEQLRRMAVAAQAVKRPGGDEDAGRSTADGGCADDYVDNRR
jgi:hypothetical protein